MPTFTRGVINNKSPGTTEKNPWGDREKSVFFPNDNYSFVLFPQSKPEALADLATFMGLNSSPELMQEVLENQKSGSLHGDYNSYGLPQETIRYMNVTMSKLLPERMLERYGLDPIYV